MKLNEEKIIALVLMNQLNHMFNPKNNYYYMT